VQPIEGPNTTIAPRDRAHRHAEAPPPRGRASVIALNPVSPSPETPTPRLGLLQSPSGEMHRQPWRASFARRARSAHGASPQAAAPGGGPGGGGGGWSRDGCSADQGAEPWRRAGSRGRGHSRPMARPGGQGHLPRGACMCIDTYLVSPPAPRSSASSGAHCGPRSVA
jgi:hypothetical protein